MTIDNCKQLDEIKISLAEQFMKNHETCSV